MTLAVTGAQVADKARFAADAVWAGVPGGRDAFAESDEQLTGDLTGGGLAYLRLAVRGEAKARSAGPSRAPWSRPVSRATRARSSRLRRPRRAGRRPLLADLRRRSRRGAAHRVRRGGGPRIAAHRRPGPRRPGPRRPAPRPDALAGRPRHAHGGPRAGAASPVLVGARRGTRGVMPTWASGPTGTRSPTGSSASSPST